MVARTYFWPDMISRDVSSSIETSLMMCASALVDPAPVTVVSELTTTVALMLVVCLFEISNANTIDVVLAVE